MSSTRFVGVTGEVVTVDGSAIEKLKSSMRGRLLVPNDDGYEKARTV